MVALLNEAERWRVIWLMREKKAGYSSVRDEVSNQPSSHQVATCVLTNPPSIRGWIRVFAFVSARLSYYELYTSFHDIVTPTLKCNSCVETEQHNDVLSDNNHLSSLDGNLAAHFDRLLDLSAALPLLQFPSDSNMWSKRQNIAVACSDPLLAHNDEQAKTQECHPKRK
jgi:hypothetical protein